MYKEEIPGYYLCKLEQGTAIYFVEKNVYDQLHIKSNSQSPASIQMAYLTKVPIKHVTSGILYNNAFHKIKLLNWEDVDISYQIDMCCFNEEIRKRHEYEFEQFKQLKVEKLLKDKLFVVVDKTTGQLAKFKHSHTTLGGEEVLVHENPCVDLGENYSMWNFPSHARAGTESHAALHNAMYGTISEEQTITSKQNNNIMNFGNIPGLNLDFGQLEGNKLALSLNGELAFRDKNGSYVTIQTEGTEKTRVEVGDLKFDVPFFKLPAKEITKGDIILLDNELLIAGEKTNGDTKFINPLTGATTNKLQRSNIFGMYFYTKIVSLFDGFGGGKGTGLGNLDPLTLMMLTQGKDGASNGGDLTQMLVLSQLAGNGKGELNPMMLMALSGNKDGGSNNMMQNIMLMQALGGGTGGGLFGKKVAKAAPRKVAKKKAAIKKAPVKG